MKRSLYTFVALLLLLTGCSAPVQQVPPGPESGENHRYGVYEFAFLVESLSGQPIEGWEFVYIYSGEEIQSGHRILFSTGVFTFHSVRVEAVEKAHPENSFSATFPVAICDGGSGKTEITVTGSNGKTSTFKVTCKVMQVEKPQCLRN